MSLDSQERQRRKWGEGSQDRAQAVQGNCPRASGAELAAGSGGERSPKTPQRIPCENERRRTKPGQARGGGEFGTETTRSETFAPRPSRSASLPLAPREGSNSEQSVLRDGVFQFYN